MSKDLSIIVPAYNVERFIEECLRSVYREGATRDGVEVLVIDDGSPDRSAEIVTRLQKEFPDLRLIRQSNKGLGGARNTGINEARGRYVWFVDSDDTLIGNWGDSLLPQLRETTADAIAICASDADPDGTVTRRFDFDGLDSEYSGLDFMATGRFSYCAPFTIYRRDFLTGNRLAFAEHLYHEDMEFTPRAYSRAGSIRLVDQSFYLVRSNPDSITRSVNFKKNFDLLTVASTLDSFARSSVDRPYRYIFNRIISLTLNSALATSAAMPPEKLRNFRGELSNRRYLFRNYVYSKNLKYICQGILFTLLPFNPEWTYNHIQKIIN